METTVPASVEAQALTERTPLALYRALCLQRQYKPNSAMEKFLLTAGNSVNDVTCLDVSRMYAGSTGMLVIIELCRHLPCLRELCVADSYLDNNLVLKIAEMAAAHETLASIDASNNQFVSWLGGMCLYQCVKSNVRLVSLNVHRTSIPPALKETLFKQTRHNARELFAARGGGQIRSSHRVTALLRALRQVFDQHRNESDLVPADVLETAALALYRLSNSGPLSEAVKTKAAAVVERAPSAALTWEEFIVLSLIRDSHVHPQLITRLHQEFNTFSMPVGASEQSEEASLVRVLDFKGVYWRLYGQSASAADLEVLRCRLDLSETMSVNWDEFLYVWYTHGPTESERLVGDVATPLPDVIRLEHF